MIDAYVYTITNKLTGEFYHGYRYRNQTLGIVPKDDLWITYFTSSNRIKNDIKKYGKTSFTATIIYENSDSVKCWQQEQIAIRQDWGNPLLLNGKYHDPESSVEIFRRVNILTEESRQKMSAAGKGRPKSENHKKKYCYCQHWQHRIGTEACQNIQGQKRKVPFKQRNHTT